MNTKEIPESTPEVNCGGCIVVHVGFALGRVDKAEARRTYQALEEMRRLVGQ
jgi:hydrogenase expression/formation protein HypC